MKQQVYITYAKAICIILMVLGHAGVPLWLHRFSCLFHMPLFFFVSGYLFKASHLQSFPSFVAKKARGIWKPYVLWTCFSILIHNIVLHPLQIVDTQYTSTQILIKMLSSLGMISTESYILPGFWFLRDLMYALLMAWCIIKVSSLLKTSLLQKLYMSLAIVACLLVAICLNLSWIWIPNVKTSTFLALSYILSAYLLQQSACRFDIKYSFWIGLLLLMLMWMLSQFFSTSMTVIQGAGNILAYYLVSMLSIVALLLFCQGLSRVKISWLDYIGTHTMDILIFHFMAFKILSYLLITWKGLSMSYMAAFTVPGYWYLYAAVGIIFPLAIAAIKAFCNVWPRNGKEAR